MVIAKGSERLAEVDGRSRSTPCLANWQTNGDWCRIAFGRR